MNYIECADLLDLPIEVWDLPDDKVSLKCPYGMDPDYITIHNTSNNASANAEIEYMQSNDNETSYHFAVDDVKAIQGLPLDRNAWHAGDGNGPGNRNSIGIEICHSITDDDEYWYENEHNGSKLAAALLFERGWGVDRLRMHQDWSGKYCPHRILDMDRWGTFIENTQEYLDELERLTSEPEEEDVNSYFEYGRNPQYDSREDFIEKIASAALDVCENYGRTKFTVPVVVAQAILESGAGLTGKAAIYNNFFGMKDRGDRVTCNDGIFESASQEQEEDGSYTDIVCYWYSFPGVHEGVEGYYQFTNIDNYANLKGVKDCYEYVCNLKADGYATSQSYVDSIMRIIEDNDLMRFAPLDVETIEEDDDMSTGFRETAEGLRFFDEGVMACSKEVYDPASDAWYWCEADGSIARSKDVYIPNHDKWVHYDAEGHMVKGWYSDDRGIYYFDPITGAMAKGTHIISCHFDEINGTLDK